jgi:outer membrane protein assembly factor BamB
LAVFEAALEFTVAVRRYYPALATNPYLESMQVRCIDGMAALKVPVPDLTPSAFAAQTRAPAEQPLIRQGAARRVRLQARWSSEVALGEEGARLHVVKGGLIVASAHAVHAFSSTGKTKFRRLATRGIATSAGGAVVCAEPSRLMLFASRRAGPSWVRDHDGVTVGPVLHERGPIGVTALNNRGVVAIDVLTGRDLWRFDPKRTQRGYLAVHGDRVLLTTDGGSVYGLDLADGQIRFRIRAAAPAVGPAVMVGRRAMFVLSQGEQSTIVLCEAVGAEGAPAGTVTWSTDVTLAHPCPPVASKNRTFIAGYVESTTQVVCLNQQGRLLWQRAVTCDARTVRLVPFESGVIGCDARGVAVRLLPDGEIDWVLGANGDELSHALAPRLARKLLVIPGPAIRVVEPLTGRVLSELDLGPHLTDFALDSKFTLYTYTEPGTLQAFTPGTLLSVIG